jgi:hypothetical protein
MSEIREATEVTKTRIYCQATTCRKCVLHAPLTIELGLAKVGNREKKTLKYSTKTVFWQIKAEAQKYGHKPGQKADRDCRVR